jgi:hypothetical protein
MMNVIQIQEALKGMPLEQLVREMQMPSGQAPQFLVLGEIARRKQMEQEFAQRQGQPQTTVAEDAVTAAGVPQQGIASAARAMAPKTDMAMNTAPTQQAPVQGMADGGYVQKMQVGGDVSKPPIQFLSDPSFITMANRQGMTVEEFWGALSPEARRQQLALYGNARPGLSRAPYDEDRVLRSYDPEFSPGMADLDASTGIAALYAPRLAHLAQARAGEAYRSVSGLGAAAYGASDTFDLPEEMRSGIARAAAEAAQTTPPRGLAGLTVPPYALRGEPAPRVAQLAPPSVEAVMEQFDVSAEDAQAIIARTYGPRQGGEGSSFVVTEAAPPGTEPALSTFLPGQFAPFFGSEEEYKTALAEREAELARRAKLDAEAAAAPAPAPAPAPGVTTGDLLAVPEGGVAELLPPGRAPSVTSPPPPPPGGAGGAGGIAAAMSPFETELTNLLQQREKRAEQDKWLALAQTGLALMGSRQPTFAGALGEAGAAGLQQFQQGRAQYDKDRLELAALLENTRLARAKLAAAGRGGGGLTAYQAARLGLDIEKAKTERLNALVAQRDALLDMEGLPPTDERGLREYRAVQAEIEALRGTADAGEEDELFADLTASD